MQSRAVQQVYESGIAEGEAKSLQEIRGQIIATLQQRFQQCPESVVKKLSTIDSLTQLLNLLVAANTFETFALFEKQLKTLN
jgi:hypothetical protein